MHKILQAASLAALMMMFGGHVAIAGTLADDFSTNPFGGPGYGASDGTMQRTTLSSTCCCFEGAAHALEHRAAQRAAHLTVRRLLVRWRW
jgi:hypothetical protein